MQQHVLRELPTLLRSLESRARCTRSHRAHSLLPILPTLFRKPLRKPLLNFRVADHAAGVDVVHSLLDLLAHVDVVLDVFERGILWELLKNLLNLVLSRFHAMHSTATPRCHAEPDLRGT